MINTKNILALAVVVLVGVFAYLVVEESQERPGEEIAESVNEASEAVADKIEDAADQ